MNDEIISIDTLLPFLNPTFGETVFADLSVVLFLLFGLFLFVSVPGLRLEPSYARSYMNVMLKSITVPVTAKPEICACFFDPGICQKTSAGFIGIK